MTTKEALLQELERIPEPVLDEVLDFVQFLRAKISTPERADAVPRENTLDKAAGLLRLKGPAPTDEQVRQWLDEELLRKYG